MSDLEEILISLYASAINVSISWIWDGDIDVKLGDPLNGYKAEDKVGTVTEIAARSGYQALPEQRAGEAVRSALRQARLPPYLCRLVPATTKPTDPTGVNQVQYALSTT